MCSSDLGGSNWIITSGTGGYGLSSKSLLYDNYSIDAGGNRDQLWAPKCDLSSFSGGSLTFDVAYADYSPAYSDTLEVEASTDCGLTFSTIYRKGGQTLASAPTLTGSLFIPTAADWRTDTIDLTGLAGNSEVIFNFVNIGHFGQALYIDNIQLTGVVSTGITVSDNKQQEIFPNPFSQTLTVRTESKDEFHLELFDEYARVIRTADFRREIDLSTEELSAGIYLCRLLDEQGRANTVKLLKTQIGRAHV